MPARAGTSLSAVQAAIVPAHPAARALRRLRAELFARDRGFDLVTRDYFHVDSRWQSLLRANAGRSEFNFGDEPAQATARQDAEAAGTPSACSLTACAP